MELFTISDFASNVFLSFLNGSIYLIFRLVYIGILGWFFQYRIFELNHTWFYWISLLILEDLCYFILHWTDHNSRLFWAVHVTHHSSQKFNFSVGFRSSVFEPLYRFLFFIPLALFGFGILDIMLVYSATQIWGILVHTQLINKLGILELFLTTPSHHRVHHGSNERYLDKNMGMLFIFWDRIFGTFQPERVDDPVKYGLTTNLTTENPAHVIFHEWKAIIADVKRAHGFRNKFMYIFGPPGWSHDGSTQTSKQLQQKIKD